MDVGFFSPLVVGLILLGVGVVGVLKGRVLAAWGFIGRRGFPVLFWFLVLGWIGVGIELLILACLHAARV